MKFLILMIITLFWSLPMNNSKFKVTSKAFEDGKVIPTKYATTGVTGGKNISLPLSWENAPKDTKSFAISIIDLHPIANNWIHWLVINIPPNINTIEEGISKTTKMPKGCKELNNSFGWIGYGGPQPPKGSGPHKYEITVYALNVNNLDLEIHTPLKIFQKSLEGKVIDSTKIVGIYER